MKFAVVTEAFAERTQSRTRHIGFYAILLFCSLAWLSIMGPKELSAAGDLAGCTVIRVYDGDTIRVKWGDKQETIRLLGIDAPETSKGKGEPGQPYSRKAQRHLAHLVLNRMVTLEVYGRDRYERVLAIVYCGRLDVNHAMLKAGMAEVYRGRTPEAFDKAPYLASEEQARQSRTGMWRQGAAYVSPIRWKHPR